MAAHGKATAEHSSPLARGARSLWVSTASSLDGESREGSSQPG